MASQSQIEQAEQTTDREAFQQPGQIPHWSLGTRVLFRLFFVYFALFCLTTQIFGGLFLIPKLSIPDPGTSPPMRQIIFWTAAHIFHVKSPLVYTGSGSGDKTFDWVQAFCLLVFAVLATVVWSVLDRRRENYVSLYKWFRLFIRFALASEMFLYGLAKAVPLQMPFPYLTRLVEPFGNFSPMGVLWWSIGAAPTYEIFAGCAETLGGLLLLVPRTTMFGALICLADMTQVFMLNMTYDVPVKLFAFHLILLALFLLVPDLPRLADFFFRNRPAGPSTQPPLFRTRRANRIALAAQIVFGIYLLGIGIFASASAWRTYGGGSPQSPLYGIWNVDQLSIDGQVRSPLLNDYGRWRRVIFDFPTFMTFQRMDDSFAGYGVAVNLHDKTLTLTKGSDKNWKARFTFERPSQDQLLLDGEMDNHRVRMQLQLFDRKK
ncbi:MAG: DoxX family protein, partial [Candidatus Acidiferrum sp.]